MSNDDNNKMALTLTDLLALTERIYLQFLAEDDVDIEEAAGLAARAAKALFDAFLKEWGGTPEDPKVDFPIVGGGGE